MASPNDNTQMISIFGFPDYNNFNEPTPFTNRPATLIGFTSAFLVCVDLRQWRDYGAS